MTRLRAILIVFGALLLAIVGLSVPLFADESDAAAKSGFLKFVEGQLSAPNRQISINGLDGVLSSDVTIKQITVSDKDGVYFEIDNAHLKWNQGALLTGRLQIDELVADSITYSRPALPDTSAKVPSPEATGFSVPDLPIAVEVKKLSAAKVSFGPQVFGLASQVSLDGSLSLSGGSLNAQLAMKRLDGPGGDFSIKLGYDGPTKNLDVDLGLSEPKNGIVANLLDLEGRPALGLNLAGSGPLSGFDASLQMNANGQKVLSGTAHLGQSDTGMVFDARLGGPIADLMPEAYRAFFGETTALTAKGVLPDGGGVELTDFTLDGGQLTMKAQAATTPDGFLRRLKLSAGIADKSGGAVLLPVKGASTSIGGAKLQVDYGDGQSWTAVLQASDLKTRGGSAQSIGFNLGGATADLSDPQKRRVTFNGDGSVKGIAADDPRIADAIGTQAGIGLAGLYDFADGLKIAQARLVGKAIEADLAGAVKNWVFDGKASLRTPSLAPFSGLAGRQLGGGASVAATGTVALLTGGFDLALDGTATDLQLGLASIDGLLTGKTTISGSVGRDAQGLHANHLRIGNARAELTANGSFASEKADFTFTGRTSDLAALTDKASGALSVTGSAKGQDGRIALDASLRVAEGSLMDKALSNGALVFKGLLEKGAFSGTLSGGGALEGHTIDLSAGLKAADGAMSLSGLKFVLAGTRVSGNLDRSAKGLLKGDLDVTSPDLSLVSALFLSTAQGALEAKVSLAPDQDQQTARIDAKASNLAVGGTGVGSARIAATAADLFGVPRLSGTLDGQAISAGGVAIETLAAKANQTGGVTRFSTTARLADGAKAVVAGSLSPQSDGYRIGLDSASLTQSGVTAKLATPTQLVAKGDTITLGQSRILVGSGQVTASGVIGQALDLSADISSVPLSIVNAVRPDLGLSGTVSGKVRVTGPASDPRTSFDVKASSVGAAMLDPFGATPLSASASGQFAKGRITIEAASVSGPKGLSAQANGFLPLVGTNGALRVTGTVPLSLADLVLRDRGTQVSGTLKLNATVGGSLARLTYGGDLNVDGGGVVDPLSNFRLQKISARAQLSGEKIDLTSFTARVATGGSISGKGTVGLDAAQGLPVDLKLKLNSARYADGTLFVATASGDLTLSGALMGDSLLKGNVRIEKADIGIPDLGPSAAQLLDVQNLDTPPAVAKTLARVHADESQAKGTSRPSVLRLDVTVSAPNQIFVRGRGIEAELGGSVRLTGPATAVQPVGGFSLIRGRLDLLNQRITFTSGQVTLVGDLNPQIDFTAQTEIDGTIVYVKVSGLVSAPDITFTSSPELPQDEVLSLLLFKRALSNLSPLQLAQLAGAAAQLTGGGDSSLLGGLRQATGLDTLDVVTDTQGNAAVKAGTYLQDNVYVGVQAGADGKSSISLDLDLTNSVKARASTSNDGESSVGLFYEEDY